MSETLCENDCIERTWCQKVTSCQTGRLCEIDGRNINCEKPTRDVRDISMEGNNIFQLLGLSAYLTQYFSTTVPRRRRQ